MIRNESEYQEAVRRLQEERARLNDHKAHLEGMGLGPDEVKRAIDPLRSFHDQLGEEVESYERLKRGGIAEMRYPTCQAVTVVRGDPMYDYEVKNMEKTAGSLDSKVKDAQSRAKSEWGSVWSDLTPEMRTAFTCFHLCAIIGGMDWDHMKDRDVADVARKLEDLSDACTKAVRT